PCSSGSAPSTLSERLLVWRDLPPTHGKTSVSLGRCSRSLHDMGASSRPRGLLEQVRVQDRIDERYAPCNCRRNSNGRRRDERANRPRNRVRIGERSFVDLKTRNPKTSSALPNDLVVRTSADSHETERHGLDPNGRENRVEAPVFLLITNENEQ